MADYFSLADCSSAPVEAAVLDKRLVDAAALMEANPEYPRCEAILGPAGSGKSTLLRERSEAEPNYCKLCAVTGIAAVNLGPNVTTINSVLGFYNEESAWDALESGRFAARFRDLADQGFKNLVIDEISMMPAGTLTAITLGAAQGADRVQQMNANRNDPKEPVGVVLLGDFLQLPPVNAPYAFTSPVWPRYEANMTKLDKIYRQSNPTFLEALQAARAGRGTTATMKLSACGVKFVNERNDFFDGTSLVPTNDMANKINATRYVEIDGTERVYKSSRWGKESSEWRDIPEALGLKSSALIMILANEPQVYEYVNGDQGHIVGMSEIAVSVEIDRNGKRHVKDIPYVLRETTQKEMPEGASEWEGANVDGTVFTSPKEIEKEYKVVKAELDDNDPLYDQKLNTLERLRAKHFARFFEIYDAYVADATKRHLPYWSVSKMRWVVGWISYMPIRLAYASTIHKTQGLTLDRIQIDARNRFAGNPGSMYVALSRCRTPENIRIVASVADFARRVQTAKECLRWV